MRLALHHDDPAVLAKRKVIARSWAGIVIGWFMWFTEKLRNELRSLTHRIDGLTRALLMDMVNRDNIGQQTREMCQQEIAKIEARLPRN